MKNKYKGLSATKVLENQKKYGLNEIIRNKRSIFI